VTEREIETQARMDTRNQNWENALKGRLTDPHFPADHLSYHLVRLFPVYRFVLNFRRTLFPPLEYKTEGQKQIRSTYMLIPA
jgi:hypothetical protein